MEKKQKKNDSGITLVALVVSIIVMLVLAGVSLNATVGENGIVTRAQEAALQQRVAEELENLNLELTKLNVDTIANDENFRIEEVAQYLVNKGVIDSYVTTSAGQIAAGIDNATGNKYFFGIKGDNTYKITRQNDGLLSAELTAYTSGGDITGGYALVTKDSFNNDDSLPEEEKGKFTITSDAEVVFMDSITGALSIKVNSGVHATVGIYANMTLSNSGVKRSAIDIDEGGSLDLYIGEGVEVTVNSGLGEDANGAIPGKGGYAGIHVPWTDTDNDGVLDLKDGNNDSDYDSYAILNIYGKGTLTAIGGNASSGSRNITANCGGAGGGGAGAGIGGNGGNGAGGHIGLGNSGGNGGNCGLVNIYNSVNVYAYGGGGGSGAPGNLSKSSAGGGGGYPAAGIGGGGAGAAGGTCCAGAGGYSGGAANGDERQQGINGLPGAGGTWDVNPAVYDWISGGGGYFAGGDGVDTNGLNRFKVALGGFMSQGVGINDRSGTGGIAGLGGVINKSKTAFVYAFNGNLYTDGKAEHDYANGINQCPIYAQMGYCSARYEYTAGNNASFTLNEIIEDVDDLPTSSYVNEKYSTGNYLAHKNVNINTLLEIDGNSILSNVDMSTQGVGSGAGYIEVSNGSYTIYNEDNNSNFTTPYTGG